jgi:type VI secretion system protein ImpA
MTNVEELLAVVSEEQPCGVDVSSDPRLQQIEMALEAFSRNRALGLELKEETKPKWDDYITTCEEMWAEGKHLSVALLLCLGWLNVEGLTGFRQGLLLIRGLIVDHWDALFPAIDEEDQRVMILENLVNPIAQEGDYFEFMMALRQASLSNSRLGAATLAEALGESVPSDRDLADVIEPSTVSGEVAIALQDSGTEFVDELLVTVDEIQGIVGELNTAVRDRIGSNAPSWEPLEQNLAAIRRLLAGFGTPESEPSVEVDVGGGDVVAGAPPQGFTGGIDSKKDVCKALDEIIKFYTRGEAYDDAEKSPVPLMARGIRRTMDLGFREMVQIFTPDTYTVLDTIAGENGDESA